MTGRLNEVDASVNPVVDELNSVDSVLLLEVSVEPSFDVVDDGLPPERGSEPRIEGGRRRDRDRRGRRESATNRGRKEGREGELASELPLFLEEMGRKDTHESSLLTKSPNPGVSTTFNLRRTPFSSMSVEIHSFRFVHSKERGACDAEVGNGRRKGGG